MKKASGPDASNVPGPISIMLPFTTTKQQHENDGDVDMMSEDKVGGGTGGYVVVVPGDVITAEQGYLRGHGTHIENGQLIATVSGIVERVNKMVCVRPLRARYQGEVGDVVVGRITEVGQGRWKVDVNARMEAILLLPSINLPGGVLRKRTYLDELNMRSYYAENDLISAEVHSFFSDGSMSLQTRTQRFGKLLNGLFMSVPPALIKRCKSHLHTFDFGVSMVFGNNGYVWLYPTADPVGAAPTPHSALPEETELLVVAGDQSATKPTMDTATKVELRQRMSRLRNSIEALAQQNVGIYPATVNAVYQASIKHSVAPKDILLPTNIVRLTDPARDSKVLSFFQL